MGDGARGSDFAALTMSALPRSKCYVGQVGGALASGVVRPRNTIRLAKTFRPLRSLAPPTKRICRSYQSPLTNHFSRFTSPRGALSLSSLPVPRSGGAARRPSVFGARRFLENTATPDGP